MKKLLVNGILDFLEKLEEIESGKIKIAEPETVINHLLAGEVSDKFLAVYLIPNSFGQMLMLSQTKLPAMFEFIYTPNPLIVSYIQVDQVNRLFLYTKEIFLPLEGN
jgi:hypothetical protein